MVLPVSNPPRVGQAQPADFDQKPGQITKWTSARRCMFREHIGRLGQGRRGSDKGHARATAAMVRCFSKGPSQMRTILGRSRASSPTRGGSNIVARWDVTNRVQLCAPSNLKGSAIGRGDGMGERLLSRYCGLGRLAESSLSNVCVSQRRT